MVKYPTTNLEECGRGTAHWNYNAWSYLVLFQQCYIYNVSVSILVKLELRWSTLLPFDSLAQGLNPTFANCHED